MENNSADAVFERLYQALQATKDAELARKLGVSRQSLANARKSGKIPDSWLIRASQDSGQSFDWIKWGTDIMKTVASKSLPFGVGAVASPIMGSLGLASAPLLGSLAIGAHLIGKITANCGDKHSTVSSDEAERIAKIQEVVSQVEQAYCERLAELEGKLELLEKERRELSEENRQLWRKNSELKDMLNDLRQKNPTGTDESEQVSSRQAQL